MNKRKLNYGKKSRNPLRRDNKRHDRLTFTKEDGVRIELASYRVIDVYDRGTWKESWKEIIKGTKDFCIGCYEALMTISNMGWYEYLIVVSENDEVVYPEE